LKVPLAIPRYQQLIWLLFCLMAGGVLLVYAFASRAAGRGEFLLPLDDVYIHFQYARQFAQGQPYVYNPGQPPTSGATSFLYPYALALGYGIGFQGLSLSLWAMIVGALALLASLWLVYRLIRIYNTSDGLALLAALIFGLTGAVNWHFMSGMETGLMIAFTLATLYTVATRQLKAFALSAALLALTRPEGGILAVIAIGVLALDLRPTLTRKQAAFLLLPLLALLIQPLVNLLVTGSAVATGNAAKSILGTVPFAWDVVIRRIWENFARMWTEFVTGVSPREGLYQPYLVGPLALLFLIGGLFSRTYRTVSALLLLWLLAGTASIATLDTAFWHFKRYQMPLLALLFPAAGWALAWIQRQGAKAQRTNWIPYGTYGLLGAGLLIALNTSAAFVQHFALNVNYVYLQPLQMARWLQANTPEDALIAVHDVGMMRYMGGRTTLDIVGLTTPGAAAYWRSGPGSVADFLIQERPDYIASYGRGHGFGLGQIANTPIYGEPLAEFPVILDDHYNVALAADYQGIYQPDWNSILPGADDTDPKTVWINAANIQSEAAVDYTWHNRTPLAGFATDIQVLQIPDCVDESCRVVDGMRRFNGTETFTVPAKTDHPVILLTALHPAQRGTLDVYVNDIWIDRNWIPEMPGYLAFVPTWIPAEHTSGNDLHIRVVPDIPGGSYQPLWHTIIPEERPVEPPPAEALARYQQGALILSGYTQHSDVDTLTLDFRWYSSGSAEGDYRFFVHLYDDVSQPPVAQADRYPLTPPAPPGNWLPGPHWDRVVVDWRNVLPGTYQLAIGFYNPYTGERLMPESDIYEVSPDGRLWLDTVTVPAPNS
jgi:hypothetical protein